MYTIVRAIILLIAVTVGAHARPIPTIALTFDFHRSAYTNAFPVMSRLRLVGTYFVDPFEINKRGPTWGQLVHLRASGWSIGAYSRYNMAAFLQARGTDAARQELQNFKDIFADHGFAISSLAPNQRAWGKQLNVLATGIFSAVRVVGNPGKLTYPIRDTMSIDDGWTPSVGSEDTIESLSARLRDLVESGELWIVVFHRVGEDGRADSIDVKTFEEFCRLIRNYARNGKLRVVSFEEALRPQQ